MTTPATLQTFHPQPSPNAEKLELLRQHFPGAIDTDAQGRMRINANALQLAIDPRMAVEEDGYELRWVGKREAYHSAFVPPQKILQPLLADSQDWDATDNLLIKGDNLDALRLLRQNYFGQVKLIYIDPPYNTQSDAFIYRDDFSARQSEVLEQLGYNADTIDYVKNIYGARTHSGWLSFMYPRLLLAKDLLLDDGVIFISIDDNEQAQLKLLCDEVFGEENFVSNIVWQNSSRQSEEIANEHEYILAYKKINQSQQWIRSRPTAGNLQSKINLLKTENKTLDEAISILRKDIDDILEEDKKNGTRENQWLLNYKNLDSDWKIYYAVDLSGEGDGPPRIFNGKSIPAPAGRHWMGQDYINELENNNRIVWRGDRAYRKLYIEESLENLKSIIRLPTRNGSEEIKAMLGKEVFSKPKPVELIKKISYFLTTENDIILDFFAGSGTTAQAVMELNAEDGGQRRFILVQIPQPIDAKKQKEAYQFVTETLGKADATIFEITAERIRRAGAKIKAQHPDVDTGFRVFDLVDDPDGLILQKPLHAATQEDFAALQQTITTPQPNQVPRVLFNLLLAEGLPLSEKIQEIRPLALYSAGKTLFILQAVDVLALRQAWEAAQAAGQPLSHISIYAPWVQDDNFLLGVNSWLDTLDLAADRLHLRG